MTEEQGYDDESMSPGSASAEPMKRSRTGKPKLFQCTGYGNCRMVFTRSEHLARHMRKHTGEKPFQCVVPGCERRFSRFDNMMQHTQTHYKSRGGGGGAVRRGNTPKVIKKKGGKARRVSGGGAASRGGQSDDMDGFADDLLPSPPPSRRNSMEWRPRRQSQQQRKSYAEADDDEEDEDDKGDDDDELLDSDSDSEARFQGNFAQNAHFAPHHRYPVPLNASGRTVSTSSLPLPPAKHMDDESYAISEQRAMFAEMRRVSRDLANGVVPGNASSAPHPYYASHVASYYPYSPAQSPVYGSSPPPRLPALASPSNAAITCVPTRRRKTRITPKVQFQPYAYQKRHSAPEVAKAPQNDSHMILPRLASYLVSHPNESPESYLLQQQQQHQEQQKQEQGSASSPSSSSSAAQKVRRAVSWPSMPPASKIITRRLSVQDLSNPIESFSPKKEDDNNNNGIKHEDDDDATGVDLTVDEIEAIQGFGRFQKCGL